MKLLPIYALIAVLCAGCAGFGKAPKSIQDSQHVVIESSQVLETNTNQLIDDLKQEAKDGRAAAVGLALRAEAERIKQRASTPEEALDQYQAAEVKAAQKNAEIAATLDKKTEDRQTLLAMQFATQRQFALLVDAFNKAGLDPASLTELAKMAADLTQRALDAQANKPEKAPDPQSEQMKKVLDLIKQSASQRLLEALTKQPVAVK